MQLKNISFSGEYIVSGTDSSEIIDGFKYAIYILDLCDICEISDEYYYKRLKMARDLLVRKRLAEWP